MRASGWLRCGVALSWLAGSGCSTLREIPRSDYAAHESRRDVRVEMNDGRLFEFDEVHVDGDTLTGYKRQDTETAFDEFSTVQLPLADVGHLRARAVDWTKTGLICAAAVGVVVVAGLAISANNNNSNNDTSGGKPPIP
jgi:hypothetical protein